MPFQEDNLAEEILYTRINFSSEIWSTRSPESIDLITKLLVVDPKMRYTIQQTREHPWMKIQPPPGYVFNLTSSIMHSDKINDKQLIKKDAEELCDVSHKQPLSQK